MKPNYELKTLASVISYCSMRLHNTKQQQLNLDVIQYANMIQCEFVEYQGKTMPIAIAKRCLRMVHNIQTLLAKLPETSAIIKLQYQLTILQTYFYDRSLKAPKSRA